MQLTISRFAQAADRQSYALTAEQVAIAIAGHDLRTFKGWIAAASSLLADAPLMTGIQEIAPM
jgi:hypothetical protein